MMVSPTIHPQAKSETIAASISRQVGDILARVSYIVTNTEPFEKSLKVANYTIGFFRELDVSAFKCVQVSNLSNSIKSFTDFTDAIKIFRSVNDFFQFKAFMKNSWQRIGNKLGLFAAGIFGSLRWVDRTFNACLGNIAAITVGRFSLLSTGKDAFVVLAALFGIAEQGPRLPRLIAIEKDSKQHLNKWLARPAELKNLSEGNQAVLEVVRQRMHSKLSELQATQLTDDETSGKIERYKRRLSLSGQKLAAEMSQSVSYKQKLWSVENYNDNLPLKRSWLAIANDVAKVVCISMVFFIIGTAATSKALLITLAALSIAGNAVGLRKLLFDEFDNTLQKSPERLMYVVPFNANEGVSAA